MIRHCLFALGSCCLLVACGSEFSAATAVGGMSGSLGGATASTGGSPALAGSDSGGQAGEDPSSDAGTDSGGTAADAGSNNDSGGAGTGGGPILGHGGSSGNAGAGGDQPVISQLGLALWLRADRGVEQSGGLVQSWLDQSGNNRNAIQTGVNVAPEYVPKGLNGLPALQFDGVRQFLQLPQGFGDFSHGLAGFMVLQPLDSECASVLELSNGSEIEDIAFGMWQNKWTYEVQVPYIQTGSVDLLSPSLYSTNHRPTVGMANATADLRINAALSLRQEMPLPDLPLTGVRQRNFVGHTLYLNCNYFHGTVSEIIVYERVVTANEVKSIESYLAQRWDLGRLVAP